jgi:protein-S-isoprenylcysteine O-methyltransferase Ste14
MMFGLIILLCWVAFLLYWFFAALTAKKNVRRGNRGGWLRVAVIVVALWILFQFPSVGQITFAFPAEIAGVIICIAGVALAIWARVHLGKNWGMPMSLKENPELVTSGPYRTIRHPIYTGIMLAMLGSSLVTPIWFVVFAAFVGYFIYSAKKEEKIMIGQFGDAYREYMKRSKMLVPFIL